MTSLKVLIGQLVLYVHLSLFHMTLFSHQASTTKTVHPTSLVFFFTIHEYAQPQLHIPCKDFYRTCTAKGEGAPLRIITSLCFEGGVTGRPKIMCPRTNVLGPLVPKSIVPGDTMSLNWYIPFIMHYAICIGLCKMTGMFQCRDIVFPGRFIQGTRGPRKFVLGHIVSGRPVTPPIWAHQQKYNRGASSWDLFLGLIKFLLLSPVEKYLPFMTDKFVKYILWKSQKNTFLTSGTLYNMEV